MSQYKSLLQSFKVLIKSDVLKGSAVISVTNAMTSVIALIATIIAVKFYSPEEFGLFSLFGSIVSVFAPIGALCLDLALYKSKDDKELREVFAASLCVFIAILFLTLFLLKIVSSSLELNENYAFVLNYYYLMALYISLGGLSRVLYSINFIKKKYKNIAAARVSETLIHHGAFIIFGYLGLSVFGACLASVLGIVVGIVALYCYTLSTPQLCSFKVFKSVLSKHISFINYSIPTVFLKNLNGSLPPLLFAALYNAETLGFLILAMRIVRVPYLTATHISQIIMSKLKEIKDGTQLKYFYLTTLIVLLIVSGLVVIGVNLITEDLFLVLFTEQWIGCLTFIKIIVAWIVFEIVFVLLMPFYIRFNRYKMLFAVEFSLTSTILILTSMLYYYGFDVVTTLTTLNFTLVTIYLLGIILPIYFMKIDSSKGIA